MNIQLIINNLSKPKLVEVVRALGYKAGDTARNSKQHYVDLLVDHNPEEALIRACTALGYLTTHQLSTAVHTEAAPSAVIAFKPQGQVEVPEQLEQPVIIGREKASKVFGINSRILSSITVDIWNDPQAPVIDPDYEFDPDHLALVLAAFNAGLNPWVYGHAGTGKSDFVRQVAARLGRSLCRINFEGSAEKYEIIGGERVKNGSTVYVEGALLVGIQRAGTIVLFDEISFCRPEHAASLHPLLERNGSITITETGKVYRPAAGVLFIAADNTNGHSDGSYGGTRAQNPALLSRFSPFVRFTYLEADKEAEIIVRRSGVKLAIAKHIVDFLSTCRASVAAGELDIAPDLRSVFAWAQLLSAGIKPRTAFEACVIEKSHPDAQEALQQLYKLKVNEDGIKAVLKGDDNAFTPAAAAQPDPFATDSALDEWASATVNTSSQPTETWLSA